MGAVERQGAGQMKNKKKNGVTRNFVGKKNGHRNHPPFNSPNSFPPYSQGMRPRPPFPPGRLPPPGMGPVPPMGVRMPPGPPPLFRTRVPPPRGMGPRSMMPGPPPMRPRPLGMPMRPLPPPLMRPPPQMMGRFPPRGPPPQMYPPNNKMRQLKNKMGKKNIKKKNTQNQFDMNSPWVSEGIRAEFTKKEELLTKAKAAAEATKTADWNAFKEQRSKCDKMYKAAKMEYIGKHPEEIFEENCDSSDEEEENSENFCDTCERSFYNNDMLQKHLQEHRVCGIDGCTFVAHSKIVEKHIEMQHITGLYYRIKKTETPEEVAEWLAERKRKYPSKENIEKRQKQQQERLKRGERIQKPNNRFGRNTKKVLDSPQFSVGKNSPKFKDTRTSQKPKNVTKEKQVSLLSSKEFWNGEMPPFAGTAELYEAEIEQEIDVAINDDEWISERNDTTKIILNNALGALIGAYRSSDESDDEIIVPIVTQIVPENIELSNDKVVDESKCDLEAPEEIKILRKEVSELPNLENKHDKNIRKRKRHHTRNQNIPTKKAKDENNPRIKNQRYHKRRITLLERLLESEIRHERNIILQCVRHVVKSNFFNKNFSVPSPNEERKCEEEVKESHIEDKTDISNPGPSK